LNDQNRISDFIDLVIVGIIGASLFSYFLGNLVTFIASYYTVQVSTSSTLEAILALLIGGPLAISSAFLFILYFWYGYYAHIRNVQRKIGFWDLTQDLVFILPACGIPWAFFHVLLSILVEKEQIFHLSLVAIYATITIVTGLFNRHRLRKLNL